MVVTQAPQSFIMLTTGKRGSGVWEGSVLSLHFIFKSKAKRSSPPFPPSASEGGHAARGCSRKTPCGGRLLSPRRQEDGSATLGERQVPGRPAPPSPARPGPAAVSCPSEPSTPGSQSPAHAPAARGSDCRVSACRRDTRRERPAASLVPAPPSLPLCPQGARGVGGRSVPRASPGRAPSLQQPGRGCGVSSRAANSSRLPSQGPLGTSSSPEQRLGAPGTPSGRCRWCCLGLGRVARAAPSAQKQRCGWHPGLTEGPGSPRRGRGPLEGPGFPRRASAPPRKASVPPKGFFHLIPSVRDLNQPFSKHTCPTIRHHF